MARVTVEDCIQKVKNRFELVLMAAKRAKDLEKGAAPTVMRDNDKATIIALREIAEETISLDGLKQLAKKGLADDFDMVSENEGEIQEETVFNIDANESYEEDDDENEIDDEDFEEEAIEENSEISDEEE